MKVRKRQMEGGRRRRERRQTQDEEKEQVCCTGTEIAGHSVNLALSLSLQLLETLVDRESGEKERRDVCLPLSLSRRSYLVQERFNYEILRNRPTILAQGSSTRLIYPLRHVPFPFGSPSHPFFPLFNPLSLILLFFFFSPLFVSLSLVLTVVAGITK